MCSFEFFPKVFRALLFSPAWKVLDQKSRCSNDLCCKKSYKQAVVFFFEALIIDSFTNASLCWLFKVLIQPLFDFVRIAMSKGAGVKMRMVAYPADVDLLPLRYGWLRNQNSVSIEMTRFGGEMLKVERRNIVIVAREGH